MKQKYELQQKLQKQINKEKVINNFLHKKYNLKNGQMVGRLNEIKKSKVKRERSEQRENQQFLKSNFVTLNEDKATQLYKDIYIVEQISKKYEEQSAPQQQICELNQKLQQSFEQNRTDNRNSCFFDVIQQCDLKINTNIQNNDGIIQEDQPDLSKQDLKNLILNQNI
ncbi:hypothetical protein PPERSA_04150 [Pseudocohnilembus persalinus]|uniref:Uncharacterized protein n=1 Tax=Pseudocohnilembus persalinus TaxID=266149 RepID=A0A0V0QMW3_PSEPJ|nr:hypothetical protein PPERSA_04150 [Pseudocohnilembus persalinus]|eukprot:KRX03598.1 hypothetical protein PPERSA_04150 [Pseudocohnilembus persalinus]